MSIENQEQPFKVTKDKVTYTIAVNANKVVITNSDGGTYSVTSDNIQDVAQLAKLITPTIMKFNESAIDTISSAITQALDSNGEKKLKQALETIIGAKLRDSMKKVELEDIKLEDTKKDMHPALKYSLYTLATAAVLSIPFFYLALSKYANSVNMPFSKAATLALQEISKAFGSITSSIFGTNAAYTIGSVGSALVGVGIIIAAALLLCGLYKLATSEAANNLKKAVKGKFNNWKQNIEKKRQKPPCYRGF